MASQRYQRWWDGLSEDVQDDFSAGAFPGYARDEIPGNGLEDIVNGLITDDGQIARRGGSVLKSLGTGGDGATFIWDGNLAPGQRTVLGSTLDWWVLSGDDTTPLNIGGTGTSALAKAAAVGGRLILPGGVIYGGSRLTTSLSVTGQPIVANKGSVTVTTSNPPTTAWTSANIQPGTLFQTTSGLGDRRIYAVKSLDSDHQITLATPYQGESFVDSINFQFVQLIQHPMPGGLYFAVANKLIAIIGDRVYESPINDPTTIAADNYHQLPQGAIGLGGEAVRDTGVVFTTEGIWAISNIGLDLVDAAGNPQQRVELVNGDIVLWSWPGVAHWGNSLVVPATDGVWLFDPVSAPRRITGGMEALYRSYVEAGYQAGYATVFKNTYFLPIVDSSNLPVDLLVCRLTPTRRGTAFGWSRLSGVGADMIGFANRIPTASSRQTHLFGAYVNPGTGSGGPIYEAKYWDQSTTTDVGSSTYDSTIVTHELAGDISTLAKKLRVRYELTDPASVNPTMTAEWAQAGDPYTALSGSAPETTKPATYTWRVSQRNPHFRLKTSGSTSNFVLHEIAIFVRLSGKQ